MIFGKIHEHFFIFLLFYYVYKKKMLSSLKAKYLKIGSKDAKLSLNYMFMVRKSRVNTYKYKIHFRMINSRL